MEASTKNAISFFQSTVGVNITYVTQAIAEV